MAEKVLVVDDEEAICETVADMLELLGCLVVKTGGVDAAEKAGELARRTGPFDVLVTDVGLLNGDDNSGFQLARELVVAGDVPAGRCIFLSGFERTLPEGIQGEFLQKPVRITDLGSALARVMANPAS